MRLFGLGAALLALLGACTDVTVSTGPQQQPTNRPTQTAAPQVSVPTVNNGPQSVRTFQQVKARMEPTLERECAARTKGVNCDFNILVDQRRGLPPNAYQTLDRNRRPVIVFTTALLQEARNSHEVAFVMAHEAAHHIRGHLPRQQQNALAGAVIFAGLATLTGASSSDVRSAQNVGAQVGARSYSKEFELEADQLGTILSGRSGYDPLVGAQFFNRIPDPGDRFLGTHPPNAQRLQMVQQTVARCGRNGAGC